MTQDKTQDKTQYEMPDGWYVYLEYAWDYSYTDPCEGFNRDWLLSMCFCGGMKRWDTREEMLQALGDIVRRYPELDIAVSTYGPVSGKDQTFYHNRREILEATKEYL